MSALRDDSLRDLWQALRPAVEMQARGELLDECRKVGHPVRDGYLQYVSEFGIVSRPQYVEMLRSANCAAWTAKCEAVFADLSGAGPDFPSAA